MDDTLYLDSGGSRISHRGSVDLVGGGGMESRGGYVSKILYVKTKESGPLEGAPGTPPRFANVGLCYFGSHHVNKVI